MTPCAADLLESIHDRMPVIVAPDGVADWLAPKLNDRPRLEAMLRPHPSEEMEAYPSPD